MTGNCPAQKPHELVELHRKHPDLTARIRHMEAVAAPHNTKAEGLWFKTDKRRPGSMTKFLDAIGAGAEVQPEPPARPLEDATS